MYKDAFERIVAALPEACRAVYGDRLKSLALYGSVARGTMRPDSDIDVFLVVEPLPPSILDRWQEFEAVEKRLALLFDEAKRAGVHTFLSAAIKTPEELRQGSFLHLDLTDQAAVRAFFAQERPDHVYLAAARVGGIHANITYPADFIRDNLLIATNVIDAAFHAGVKKLLFLGSSCIYPRLAPQPMPEAALLTGPLEPTNEPYAIAKIAGIKLCESYNRQYGSSHGIDYRSVMPTNLYGPGDNYHPENSHVIPALIRRFHEAKVAGSPRVVVWGSGTPRREFLHVDDLAAACLHVMNLPRSVYAEHTAPMRSHLNVGCGQDITIAELARLIAKVMGYTGEIVFDPSKPDGAPRKLLDTGRIMATGWQPRVTLEEGLASTYADFVRGQVLRVRC